MARTVRSWRRLRRRVWRLAGHRLVVTTALVGLVLYGSSTRSGRAAILPANGSVPGCGETEPLRLATLNVFGLPWPLAPDAEARCRRIAATIGEAGVDVLALQEVWSSELQAAFAVAGYHRVCDEDASLIGGCGLLTLSRHPVRGAELRHFAAEGGIERVVQKGVLRTVLALPGGDLDVWNLHLQSGLADAEVRTAQIDELLAWLGGDAAVPFAAVVGDFNCAPGDAEFERLSAGLRTLGFEHAPCGAPTYDASSNPLATPEPPAEIDHLFVRWPARDDAVPRRARRVHDTPGPLGFVSDHYGVELELPRRQRRRQKSTPSCR